MMGDDTLVFREPGAEIRVELWARNQPNDAVMLIETINGGESNRLHIPAESRAAVALALLGGIDAAVERLAIWYLEEQFLEGETPKDFYTDKDFDEEYRDILRAAARKTLGKAFGPALFGDDGHG